MCKKFMDKTICESVDQDTGSSSTMSRVIFLFIVMGVLFSTSKSQQCPGNQEWNPCGSACPRTCNSPEGQPCTLQCVPGCECRSGFLLNNAGQCVPPHAC